MRHPTLLSLLNATVFLYGQFTRPSGLSRCFTLDICCFKGREHFLPAVKIPCLTPTNALWGFRVLGQLSVSCCGQCLCLEILDALITLKHIHNIHSTSCSYVRALLSRFVWLILRVGVVSLVSADNTCTARLYLQSLWCLSTTLATSFAIVDVFCIYLWWMWSFTQRSWCRFLNTE